MPAFFNQVQLDSNAIANGTIPLAQVDYIKGAFKVMTSGEASSLSAFEQWDPGQIVYFTDSSSLWQYNYVPFNPGQGVFSPYSYFKEIEFYPSFVSASFNTSNDSLTLFANSLEDGDVDSSGNRGPNSQVSMSIDLSSLAGGGGSVNTGSLLVTGSAALNVITFTKGDGSTFAITVDTGSGGGSADLTQQLTANLTVGGVTSGDSFASGSSIESLLRDMLITYQQPTLGTLNIRNGGSSINTTIYDVGASFTCDDATFTAGVDSPNGDYPQSASLSCTGADIGSFTEDGPDNVGASNTITFSTSRVISRASDSGTVSFTVTTDSRNSGDTQSRGKSYYFRWRNYLAASSTIISDGTTLQSVLDNDLVQSPLDTNRSWTATCNSDNNDGNNYTYIIYPSTYGNLSGIIQDGATPVLGAFNDAPIGTFTATNSQGSSRNWIVYKTNDPGAFSNGTTLAIS